MSELQWVHLLEAHSAELLAECHRAGRYLAVCGAELAAGDLPPAWCEPRCEWEGVYFVYCLECIRTANARNHDAGVDVDCPPGIVVRTER